MNWPVLFLTALSLSIGWGIRGNFGHEYGAMIPGALAAMAACLLSGREDWWRRVAFFAFFGAVGWSFGGSMSYGHVLGYVDSGVSSSVIYGFACLFIIGFLWAAIGGAATVLPACLSRERVTEFCAPLLAVFVAWTLQDLAMAAMSAVDPMRRHESALYWYDTDWLAALLAIVAVLALAVARGRICPASRLILCMAGGWWAGFLLLVNVLGLRMTPPRSDNWAGAAGMTAGMLVYLLRNDLRLVAHASLLAGFVGGLGFSGATCIKLVAMKSGLHTNWHSILEQTYGFINGIGIAVAMRLVSARSPRVTDEPPARRWTDAFAVFFTLLIITYVNLAKNPEEWVRLKNMPGVMYGRSADAWFNLGYLLLSTAAVVLLARHLRRPLALVPAGWLGKGQLLYLVLLWWMVIGNFERALPGFQPSRLVTEGVIFVNAVACTVLLLLCAGRSAADGGRMAATAPRLGRAAIVGILAMMVAVAAETGIVRALYGDMPVSSGTRHIRFGPGATATHEKPAPGQPHP